MKPERAFVADRAVAQHAPELLRRGPDPADLLPGFGRLGERFARALAPLLAPLHGGERPEVACQRPCEWSDRDHAEAAGALAAHCLFATAVPGVTLLASIEGAGVLRLVDRAFGGKGEAPQVLPAAFPLSAELTIERLEALTGRGLAEALGQAEPDGLRALRGSANLSELAPFPAGARLAALCCVVGDSPKTSWKLTLALPQAMLPKLLGKAGARAPGAAPSAADPAARPFAAVPMPLTATLVDMRVSLAAVSRLEPGAVLPVAVARSVPLAIGGAEIARGSVGSQDDRVALKLTRIA